MHDLGKMIFAFSIFWMYLFFSQYIVIWYGNLPEETQFFSARLGTEFLQDTWYFEGLEPRLERALREALAVRVDRLLGDPVLGAARPAAEEDAGDSSAASRRRRLFGFWLERNALVWPSLVPDDAWAWLGPIQIGIALGFLGAFALVFLIFTRVFPTLPCRSAERLSVGATACAATVDRRDRRHPAAEERIALRGGARPSCCATRRPAPAAAAAARLHALRGRDPP